MLKRLLEYYEFYHKWNHDQISNGNRGFDNISQLEEFGSPREVTNKFESPLINTNKVLIPPRKGELLYHTDKERLIAKLPTADQKEKAIEI